MLTGEESRRALGSQGWGHRVSLRGCGAETVRDSLGHTK
jgi:hypothetical protein